MSTPSWYRLIGHRGALQERPLFSRVSGQGVVRHRIFSPVAGLLGCGLGKSGGRRLFNPEAAYMIFSWVASSLGIQR